MTSQCLSVYPIYIFLWDSFVREVEIHGSYRFLKDHRKCHVGKRSWRCSQRIIGRIKIGLPAEKSILRNPQQNWGFLFLQQFSSELRLIEHNVDRVDFFFIGSIFVQPFVVSAILFCFHLLFLCRGCGSSVSEESWLDVPQRGATELKWVRFPAAAQELGKKS